MAESPRPPTSEKIRTAAAPSATHLFAEAALDEVKAAPIVPINLAELSALLGRLRPQLAPSDYQVVEGWVQTALYLDELVERRELAIHRLRRLAEARETSTAEKSRAQTRAGRRAAFMERPWRR
jgi:hypothetical protein